MADYEKRLQSQKNMKLNSSEVGIFNNRTYATLWIVFLISMIAVIIISLTSVSEMRLAVKTEEEAYMREAATENARALKRGLEDQLRSLNRVASIYGAISDKRGKEHFLILAQEESSMLFLGYMDAFGTLTNISKTDVMLSDADRKVIYSADTAIVFDSILEGPDGEDTIAYAIPFTDGSESTLIAVQDKNDLDAYLQVESFGGMGYARVISSDGTCILTSNSEKFLNTGDNYFDVVRNQASMQGDNTLNELIESIALGESGNFAGAITGYEKMKVAYVPLGISDWYDFIVIPASYSEQRLAYYTELLTFISIILPLIFAALLVYVIVLYHKSYRQVLQLAFHDAVTSGFNLLRGGMEEKRLLASAKPYEYAYVVMDVRNFKLINDEFGIERGNQALVLIHDVLQETIGDEESFCHVGGDIFYLLIKNTTHSEMEKRLEMIVERINDENETNGRISNSFYIAWGVFPIDKPDMNMVTIRDRANIARKQAVRIETAKRSTCVFYDDTEHKRLMSEQHIVNQTNQAITDGEFTIFLQPKYDLILNRFTCAEALVRWIKNGKTIMPDAFLPLFERNGLIVEIDRFVFTLACTLQRHWLDTGRTPIPIACNFTRADFTSELFVESLLDIVNRYNVPINLLELEITESMAFDGSPLIDRRIEILKRQGFSITIDDFGVGYSSLKRLLNVNADVLKLDKSFFSSNGASRAHDIVSSVIAMAHGLNMKVVAEGVESEEQVESLRTLQCDMIQGFVFARPLSVKEYEDFNVI